MKLNFIIYWHVKHIWRLKRKLNLMGTLYRISQSYCIVVRKIVYCNQTSKYIFITQTTYATYTRFQVNYNVIWGQSNDPEDWECAYKDHVVISISSKISELVCTSSRVMKILVHSSYIIKLFLIKHYLRLTVTALIIYILNYFYSYHHS